MSELVLYNAARKALAEARAVDEVVSLIDKAARMKAYAEVAKDKAMETDAAEIRWRAERRLGEMIAEQKAAVGLAKGGEQFHDQPSTGIQQNPVDRAITLKEMGIDKNLADRARKLAAIPEPEFEGMVGDYRKQIEDTNERVTTNILKAGARAQRHAEANAGNKPLPDGKKYRVGYFDPPWPYEVRGAAGKDRSEENHYPTMTLDDIAAMPIGQLMDETAGIFVWVPWPILVAGLHLPVLEAWGFKPSSLGFDWIKLDKTGKPLLGRGYMTRQNSEVCIFAWRGDKMPERLNAGISSVVFTGTKGENSAKPEEVARRIEFLIDGPYVELFARHAREGWTVWGNEVGKWTEDQLGKALPQTVDYAAPPPEDAPDEAAAPGPEETIRELTREPDPEFADDVEAEPAPASAAEEFPEPPVLTAKAPAPASMSIAQMEKEAAEAAQRPPSDRPQLPAVPQKPGQSADVFIDDMGPGGSALIKVKNVDGRSFGYYVSFQFIQPSIAAGQDMNEPQALQPDFAGALHHAAIRLAVLLLGVAGDERRPAQHRREAALGLTKLNELASKKWQMPGVVNDAKLFLDVAGASPGETSSPSDEAQGAAGDASPTTTGEGAGKAEKPTAAPTAPSKAKNSKNPNAVPPQVGDGQAPGAGLSPPPSAPTANKVDIPDFLKRHG